MNDTAPTTAVATRDPVAALLETNRKSFEAALPRQVHVDRFLRIALTTIKRTPKLLEADRRSLIAALMTAAQLGLEPDGIMGHAYLVPFSVKNRATGAWETQVQLIPGYRGLIHLARQSDEISTFQVKVVREGDEFEYGFGFEETLKHVPKSGNDKPMTHVWMVVKDREGRVIHWDVMDRRAIDRIMLMSQGYQRAEKPYKDKPARKDSPWHLHYEAMAMKTIIRANAKFLPMKVETLQRAAAIDEAVDLGGIANIDPTSGGVTIEGTSEEVEESGEGGEPPADEKPAPAAQPEPTPQQTALPSRGQEKVQSAAAPTPAPVVDKQPERSEPAPAQSSATGAPPDKPKRGRPAKKVAAAPPPPAPEPEEVLATPIDPLLDPAGTGLAPDVYLSRVKKAFKDARNYADADTVTDRVDWKWLEGADVDIYNEAVDAMNEALDRYRDQAPREDDDATGGEGGDAEPPPADEAGDPLDVPPFMDRRQQAAPVTAQPAEAIPDKAIPWISPAQRWAELFIKEVEATKTSARLNALARVNNSNLTMVQRNAAAAHEKIVAAVAAARKRLGG